jgi:hypothetical protein
LISGNDFAFTETRLIATAIYSRTKQQHKNVTDAGRNCEHVVASVACAAKQRPQIRAQENVTRNAAAIIGRWE